MEERLCEAAIDGNLEALHQIIGEDGRILDKIVAGSFNRSPLHVAASHGHTNFVKQLLHRKPKLAEVLDSEYRSALHLASAEGHVQIVIDLIATRPEMCLARDREGKNPLHIAAVKGKVEVLHELYKANSNAAHVRVDRDETILHLCVHHSQLETLEVLLKTVKGENLVNATDSGGNTILHIAISMGEFKVVSCVLNTKINVNAINASGHTAMDVLILAQNGTNPVYFDEECVNAIENSNCKRAKELMKFDWLRRRDVLMVVASVIAAMTFEAAGNPPGGVWQDNADGHKAGEAVMAYNNAEIYPYFFWVNTLGFIASLILMFLLTNLVPLGKRAFMLILVVINSLLITSITISFAISNIAVASKTNKKKVKTKVVVTAIVCGSVITLYLLAYTVRLIADVIKEQQSKEEAYKLATSKRQEEAND